MKCPHCNADIAPNTNYCEFCGSQISYDMKREQEQLNKAGCPKCGSSNVTFNREKQGEVKGKNASAVVRRTVGVCKDCGYTWFTDDTGENKKKAPIWLWVLGWICIFPVPLTILMLRNKEMKPAVKYGIIAAAWIFYLCIGIFGSPTDDTKVEDATTVTETTVADTTDESDNQDDVQSPIKEGSIVINAVDKGEYGQDLVLNEDTDMPDNIIGHFVPAGTYEVTNLRDKPTQVNVYKNEKHVTEEGWEEWADGHVILLQPDETEEITVEDGYFVNVDGTAEVVLNSKN